MSGAAKSTDNVSAGADAYAGDVEDDDGGDEVTARKTTARQTTARETTVSAQAREASYGPCNNRRSAAL